MTPLTLTRNAVCSRISTNVIVIPVKHEAGARAHSGHDCHAVFHLGPFGAFAIVSPYVDLDDLCGAATQMTINASAAGFVFGTSARILPTHYITAKMLDNRVPTLINAGLEHARRRHATDHVRISRGRQQLNHFPHTWGITSHRVTNQRHLHARILRATARAEKCITFR